MPRLKLLGLLRAAAGTPLLTVPATTVEEVLATATRDYVALAKLLFPHGDSCLSNDVGALVNGRDISFLHGLATPVTPSDTVTLFYHGARAFPGG